MIAKKKIETAQHIAIVVNNDSFAYGSVLYSIVVILHKKVSFISQEPVSLKYSFLPWYDKVRMNMPNSVDCTFYLDDITTQILYNLLQEFEIKINKKIALALYSALLHETNFFQKKNLDGTLFAIAYEMVEKGADHALVVEFLKYSQPLSLFRLRAYTFKKMQLHANAKEATLCISQEILKACGASLKDMDTLMQEVLMLAHVECVLLKDSDSNTIIKTIKETI